MSWENPIVSNSDRLSKVCVQPCAHKADLWYFFPVYNRWSEAKRCVVELRRKLREIKEHRNEIKMLYEESEVRVREAEDEYCLAVAEAESLESRLNRGENTEVERLRSNDFAKLISDATCIIRWHMGDL